jgi:hypothetical protein
LKEENILKEFGDLSIVYTVVFYDVVFPFLTFYSIYIYITTSELPYATLYPAIPLVDLSYTPATTTTMPRCYIVKA